MQSIILTTAVLLFPFWGAMWEKAPLTNIQLEQKAVYSMDEALYPVLRQQISASDARMRRRFYHALANAPIPANQDFLLNDCLPKEKNSELRASILRFMHKMEPEKVPMPLLESLLKEEAPVVMLEAMRLYCLRDDAKASVLMKFLGTPEQRYEDALLEKTAWNAFADRDAFADKLGKRVFDFRKSPFADVRQLALRAALGQRRRGAEVQEWIEEALAGSDEMKLAVAQDRHPSSAKIPMKLLKEKSLVIRQALCEAPGTRQFPSVLFAALKDKAPSVRIAALKSIAAADRLESEDASKIFALFNDSSFLVHSEAEETLVALASKCDLLGLLEEGILASSDKMVRFHSLNAARRIGARALAKQIAAELSKDDSPEIAAASLDALSVLAGKGEYAQKIIPFGEHKSPLVRQMAARAMGRLQLPGSENALKRLGSKGSPHNVYAEAMEAMGRFPQPVFITALIACLRMTSDTTFEARANAAWALGRMNGDNAKALIPAAKRLVEQCTTQVIKGEDPAYDDISVIANSLWSLAALAKRTGNKEIGKCYETVASAYDVSLEELRNPSNNGTLPLSEMTCCMIRQVRQYFEGKEPTTMPMPTQKLELPVRQLEQPGH